MKQTLALIATIKKLERMNVCKGALEWLETQKSMKTAYENCEKADWLLWLAEEIGIDRKILVSAACDCAVTSLKYVKKGDEAPRISIRKARLWVRGKANKEEVRKAASVNYISDAAYAASDAASDAASCAAAYAAYAAFIAYSAANAAAYAAASDAAAYAASAAGRRVHKKLAKIVKRRIPLTLFKKSLMD